MARKLGLMFYGPSLDAVKKVMEHENVRTNYDLRVMAQLGLRAHVRWQHIRDDFFWVQGWRFMSIDSHAGFVSVPKEQKVLWRLW